MTDRDCVVGHGWCDGPDGETDDGEPFGGLCGSCHIKRSKEQERSEEPSVPAGPLRELVDEWLFNGYDRSHPNSEVAQAVDKARAEDLEELVTEHAGPRRGEEEDQR